jgi:hypothetical protein
MRKRDTRPSSKDEKELPDPAAQSEFRELSTQQHGGSRTTISSLSRSSCFADSLPRRTIAATEHARPRGSGESVAGLSASGGARPELRGGRHALCAFAGWLDCGAWIGAIAVGGLLGGATGVVAEEEGAMEAEVRRRIAALRRELA